MYTAALVTVNNSGSSSSIGVMSESFTETIETCPLIPVSVRGFISDE